MLSARGNDILGFPDISSFKKVGGPIYYIFPRCRVTFPVRGCEVIHPVRLSAGKDLRLESQFRDALILEQIAEQTFQTTLWGSSCETYHYLISRSQISDG